MGQPIDNSGRTKNLGFQPVESKDAWQGVSSKKELINTHFRNYTRFQIPGFKALARALFGNTLLKNHFITQITEKLQQDGINPDKNLTNLLKNKSVDELQYIDKVVELGGGSLLVSNAPEGVNQNLILMARAMKAHPERVIQALSLARGYFSLRGESIHNYPQFVRTSLDFADPHKKVKSEEFTHDLQTFYGRKTIEIENETQREKVTRFIDGFSNPETKEILKDKTLGDLAYLKHFLNLDKSHLEITPENVDLILNAMRKNPMGIHDAISHSKSKLIQDPVWIKSLLRLAEEASPKDFDHRIRLFQSYYDLIRSNPEFNLFPYPADLASKAMSKNPKGIKKALLVASKHTKKMDTKQRATYVEQWLKLIGSQSPETLTRGLNQLDSLLQEIDKIPTLNPAMFDLESMFNVSVYRSQGIKEAFKTLTEIDPMMGPLFSDTERADFIQSWLDLRMTKKLSEFNKTLNAFKAFYQEAQKSNADEKKLAQLQLDFQNTLPDQNHFLFAVSEVMYDQSVVQNTQIIGDAIAALYQDPTTTGGRTAPLLYHRVPNAPFSLMQQFHSHKLQPNQYGKVDLTNVNISISITNEKDMTTRTLTISLPFKDDRWKNMPIQAAERALQSLYTSFKERTDLHKDWRKVAEGKLKALIGNFKESIAYSPSIDEIYIASARNIYQLDNGQLRANALKFY